MRNVFFLACSLAVLVIVSPGCGEGGGAPTGNTDPKAVAPPLPSKPPLKSGKRIGVAPHS